MFQLFDSNKRKPQKNPSNSPAMKRAQKINWALVQVSGAESNLRQQMYQLDLLYRAETDYKLKNELQILYGNLSMAANELRISKELIQAFNERRKQERKQNGNRKS